MCFKGAESERAFDLTEEQRGLQNTIIKMVGDVIGNMASAADFPIAAQVPDPAFNAMSRMNEMLGYGQYARQQPLTFHQGGADPSVQRAWAGMPWGQDGGGPPGGGGGTGGGGGGGGGIDYEVIPPGPGSEQRDTEEDWRDPYSPRYKPWVPPAF